MSGKKVVLTLLMSGAVVLSVAVQNAFGQVQYTVTDLGAGEATAINASGQVVVNSFYESSDSYHAFIYSNGTMTDLGVVPNSDGSFATATAINNSGQVVGSENGYAFLYSNGAFSSQNMVGVGVSSQQGSCATAINNSGQVAGYYTTGGFEVGVPMGVIRAFLYNGGMATDLGTLGGSQSSAYGINDNGQVVGYADTSSGNAHAFLYSNGTMTDLGTLSSYTESAAYAINVGGQVVGESSASTAEHAFLYSNGTMTDLGTLPGYYSYSSALGINDNGQVVGYAASNPYNGPEHAFVYSNGTMTDLNSLMSLWLDTGASKCHQRFRANCRLWHKPGGATGCLSPKTHPRTLHPRPPRHRCRQPACLRLATTARN